MKELILMVAALAVAVAACGGTTDSELGEPAAATTLPPTTATTAAPATTTTLPTTAAPATTTTSAATSEIEPTGDPDVDAIVLAYTVAFDSKSDFAAKQPYIVDAADLEQTVIDYLSIGETMGGVSVTIKDVVVNGDAADVAYDLMFNNNPTYPDLAGTAVLTADGWQVPRDVFCSLMTSARVGCPAR